jgi:hypothetical protein
LFIRPEAAAHLELCARLIRRIKWGFEDGPKESEEQLAWRADLRQSLTPRVRLVRENHSHFLALANRLVEVSKQPPHQAFRAIDTLTREYEQAEADHPDEYFKILSSASSTKLGKSILKNLALTHCTCVGIACERFRSKHGRWPDTLNQLVPEFMDELPIDPFDGKPIKATRTKEGFTVYSSGYDGKDDGGTLHDQNGEYDRGPDIGFRLWDPKHRRLPPVPKPKPVVETEDPVKDPPPPS